MQVEIERLAFGGKGVAREDGKVIFVKGGLPGDVLDVKITRDRGSYAESVIKAVVKPSAERVEPECRVFGICGGCQLQHLAYNAQLREKEAIFTETLERIGGFSGLPVEPIFPAPENYGYRARVRLSAWYYSGGWHAGYNTQGSRKKVAVGSCPVADGPINQAIARISDTLSSIDNSGYPLESINISSDGKSAYISLTPRDNVAPDALNTLARHLRRFVETENVSAAGRSEAAFETEIEGVKFQASPSVFTQANAPVNRAIVDTVLDWADGSPGGSVLDLYSGIGNFSLPLARQASSVESVEISRQAVGFARKSADINGIRNIAFHNAPCETAVGEMLKARRGFGAIVLDPPREGAREAVSGIAGLNPEKIIYVSCDPATLARDLKVFREKGYEPVRVRPFDMFPQTYHIESVSLLTKS